MRDHRNLQPPAKLSLGKENEKETRKPSTWGGIREAKEMEYIF